MPWNGSGTFALGTAPIGYQSVSSSSDMNAKFADFVAGLNNTIPRDGQAAPTANLPMGTYRHTGVGAGVSLTDYVRLDQAQNRSMTWCSTVGGTANAITLSMTPAPSAYADGQAFEFLPSATNTGSVTVNVNGLGAKNVRVGTRGLSAGTIVSGRPAKLVYDGTNFQLMNPVRWFYVDDYFQGDADVAINAAIASAASAGGGLVQLGYATYTCNADITLGDYNEVGLIGMGPNASILDFAAGGKLEVKGSYDWLLANFAVQNGTGDNILVGNATGAQAFCAWFGIQNVVSASATGRGFSIEKAYMGEITRLRSFQAGGIGLDFGGGLNTSLTISSCHALQGSSDGWRLRNMTYCSVDNAGADQNDGYGYLLQGLNSCRLHGGAENNGKAALQFHNDSTSGDTITSFEGVLIEGFASISNAQTVTTNGEIAHFTSATAAQDAGKVEFRGVSARSQTQESFHIESGAYHIVCPWQYNSMAETVKGGSFSVILDGATDVASGLPVNITGAATPIATIAPKMRNGIQSMGGQIIVYACNNNLASASKAAVYNLLVIEYSGGKQVVEQAKAGLTSGAASDEASFTFDYDATNNHLEATPVGSTATGNWYFYFSVIGQINITPL